MEAQLTCIFFIGAPSLILTSQLLLFLFMLLLLDECCFSTQYLLCLLKGCLGPICWSGQPLVVQMCLPNLSTEKSQVAWWPERGHRNAEAKQPTYGDSQRTIWIPAKTASYVVLVLGHFQNLIQFCPLLCCKEYIFILQTRPLGTSVRMGCACNSHEKYKYKVHNAKGT